MAPGTAPGPDAMRRTLDWLARRDRSEREIRDRLLRWSVDEATAAGLIEKLRARGLVDDRALARKIADWHERHDPLGPSRLRQKLIARSIAAEDAVPVLDAMRDWSTQLESARRVFDKKLPRLGALPREKRWRRMNSHLERRGFERGIIIELCRSLLDGETETEAFD